MESCSVWDEMAAVVAPDDPSGGRHTVVTRAWPAVPGLACGCCSISSQACLQDVVLIVCCCVITWAHLSAQLAHLVD